MKEWDKKGFSKRLKEARSLMKLTQQELAKMAGVSSMMISAYENPDSTNGKNPAISNIIALSNVLGVSIDWLCGFDTLLCGKCLHCEICRKKDELPQYVCEHFKEAT